MTKKIQALFLIICLLACLPAASLAKVKIVPALPGLDQMLDPSNLGAATAESVSVTYGVTLTALYQTDELGAIQASIVDGKLNLLSGEGFFGLETRSSDPSAADGHGIYNRGSSASDSRPCWINRDAGSVTSTYLTQELRESITVTVGDDGDEDFSSLAAALTWAQRIRVPAGRTLTIQLDNDGYSETITPISFSHPDGARIRILGYTTAAASVAVCNSGGVTATTGTDVCNLTGDVTASFPTDSMIQTIAGDITNTTMWVVSSSTYDAGSGCTFVTISKDLDNPNIDPPTSYYTVPWSFKTVLNIDSGIPAISVSGSSINLAGIAFRSTVHAKGTGLRLEKNAVATLTKCSFSDFKYGLWSSSNSISNISDGCVFAENGAYNALIESGSTILISGIGIYIPAFALRPHFIDSDDYGIYITSARGISYNTADPVSPSQHLVISRAGKIGLFLEAGASFDCRDGIVDHCPIGIAATGGSIARWGRTNAPSVYTSTYAPVSPTFNTSGNGGAFIDDGTEY